MARPAIKSRPATARAGNYVAPIDTTGMDPQTIIDLTGKKANKLEEDYIKGTGARPSAIEAVRRARRANKQPPLKGY